MPTALEIASILSLIVAIIGLGFGYIEYRKRTETEIVLRTQLNSLLNRVRSMVPYKKDMESILEGVESSSVIPWAWNKYKGLSDLYVAIVTYYLSLEKKFNYDDLGRLVKAGVVQTSWEEQIWRDIIALRPENKTGIIPDFFIKK